MASATSASCTDAMNVANCSGPARGVSRSRDNGDILRISPMGVRAGLRARPFMFARLDDSVLNEDEVRHLRKRLAAVRSPNACRRVWRNAGPCSARSYLEISPDVNFRLTFPFLLWIMDLDLLPAGHGESPLAGLSFLDLEIACMLRERPSAFLGDTLGG